MSGRPVGRWALPAGLLIAVFIAYAALGWFVKEPRIFVDEVRYMEAATSFAHDGVLRIRGGAYDFPPAFPVAVSPAVALARDPAGAYAGIKLLNAFFFALAAVPAYLLARRLLPHRTSVAVALAAVAIPA